MKFNELIIKTDLATQVHHRNELDSTMLEAERLHTHSEITLPLLVLADTQLKGSGRGTNDWYSPEGGLWFSYLVRIQKIYPSMPLFIGSAIHRAISALFPQLEPKLRIKWTNDLYYEDQKLGGILIRRTSNVYNIGIGINTNLIVDNETQELRATSLKQILGFDVDHSFLLYHIIKTIHQSLNQLDEPDTYIGYCNRCLYGRGQRGEVKLHNRVLKGEILRITEDGGLLLKTIYNTEEKVLYGSLSILFS